MSSNVKVLDLLQPCLQSVQSHISTSQAKINFNITALPPNQRERERERGGPVHAGVLQFNAKLHVVQNYDLLDMMPLLNGN